MRRVCGVMAGMLVVVVVYFGMVYVQHALRHDLPVYRYLGAQAIAAWCTFGTDCSGTGGRVSGSDWNDARLAAVKSGDTAGGNLGGTFPNPDVVQIQGGTAFPGSPTVGDLFIAIDDSTPGACDSAAGSAATLCRWTGSVWAALSGSALGLDANFDIGKVIDGANSEANSMQVGNGTDACKIWAESGTCRIAGPSAGTVQIKANITLHTSTPVTIATADCTNHEHISNNTTAREFDLCDPTGGETICISDDAGSVVTIDPNGSDVIVLNGTAQAGGDAIVSTGTRGDFCCMIAKDASTWLTKGCQGFS